MWRAWPGLGRRRAARRSVYRLIGGRRSQHPHGGDEQQRRARREHGHRQGVAELIIAKQRNGPTDAVKLSWIERCTRFKDFSPAVAPVEYEGVYQTGPDAGEPPI